MEKQGDITTYSPYVTFVDSSSVGIYEDSIFDYIKVVSDDPADSVIITVTPLGSIPISVKVSSGDNIFGPFSSFNVTTISGAAMVIAHERHITMETIVVEKTTDTGYTNGIADTYQIQDVPTNLGIVNEGYLTINATVNAGTSGADLYTLGVGATLTKISKAGLITFKDGAVFNKDFKATITYQIKLKE